VKPSVQTKLDEMWIPVETVTLDAPAVDLESAKTAPLPAVNTSGLKPRK